MSGALITADYTLEQGRELFGVPGKIVARKSRGTNRLIQEGGAKLIISVEDTYGRVELDDDRRAPRGARDPPRE